MQRTSATTGIVFALPPSINPARVPVADFVASSLNNTALLAIFMVYATLFSGTTYALPILMLMMQIIPIENLKMWKTVKQPEYGSIC